MFSTSTPPRVLTKWIWRSLCSTSCRKISCDNEDFELILGTCTAVRNSVTALFASDGCSKLDLKLSFALLENFTVNFEAGKLTG